MPIWLAENVEQALDALSGKVAAAVISKVTASLALFATELYFHVMDVTDAVVLAHDTVAVPLRHVMVGLPAPAAELATYVEFFGMVSEITTFVAGESPLFVYVSWY